MPRNYCCCVLKNSLSVFCLMTAARPDMSSCGVANKSLKDMLCGCLQNGDTTHIVIAPRLLSRLQALQAPAGPCTAHSALRAASAHT